MLGCIREPPQAAATAPHHFRDQDARTSFRGLSLLCSVCLLFIPPPTTTTTPLASIYLRITPPSHSSFPPSDPLLFSDASWTSVICMCGGGGVAPKVRGHGESNPAAVERKRLGRGPASWPGSLVSKPEAIANWEYGCFCCW